MTIRCMAALCMVLAVAWLAPAEPAAQSQEATADCVGALPHGVGRPESAGRHLVVRDDYAAGTAGGLRRAGTPDRGGGGRAERGGADARRSAAAAGRHRGLQRVLVRPRRVDRAHVPDRRSVRRTHSLHAGRTPAAGRAPRAARPPGPRPGGPFARRALRAPHQGRPADVRRRLQQPPADLPGARLRRRLDRAEPRRAHHSDGRPPAGRRMPSGSGWATRAAGGRATRWWSRRPTSAARPTTRDRPTACT